MTHFISIDTSACSLSRNQRRTRIAALDYLLGKVSLRGQKRLDAEERIFSSKQPMVDAKRLVKLFEREKAGNSVNIDEKVDFSNVQALRVKIIRKIGFVYPSDAHSMLLNRMDEEIAAGTMTKERFLLTAASLSKMKLRKNDRDGRKLEARCLRGSGHDG